jgi:palmitoyltransferase
MATEILLHSDGVKAPPNTQSIEERSFQVALMMVESWFTERPPIGARTRKCTVDTIRRIMEKTLNKPEIRQDSSFALSGCRTDSSRELLAKNVDIWIRLEKAFKSALPRISVRSLREPFTHGSPQQEYEIPDTSSLIAENHASLVEDLTLLNNLLVIARNMLAIKEAAQDLCAAVQVDGQVVKLIDLCVGVTSKGYDGETIDNLTRSKVNEVTELCKPIRYTSEQTPLIYCRQEAFSHEPSISPQFNNGQRSFKDDILVRYAF